MSKGTPKTVEATQTIEDSFPPTRIERYLALLISQTEENNRLLKSIVELLSDDLNDDDEDHNAEAGSAENSHA